MSNRFKMVGKILMLSTLGLIATYFSLFLIFTLFHFPCATTILTIKKETNSWYYTFLSMIIPTFIGLLLCLLIHLFEMFFFLC